MSLSHNLAVDLNQEKKTGHGVIMMNNPLSEPSQSKRRGRGAQKVALASKKREE